MGLSVIMLAYPAASCWMRVQLLSEALHLGIFEQPNKALPLGNLRL
jgi:hypothetical protein